MSTPKAERKRLYRYSGFYTLQRSLKPLADHAGWLDELGEVGEALKAWQEAIVTDLGGDENLSAMERSIIEMATKTHLILASVDRFILEAPSLVHKSRRQLFPVVVQRQVLADALARYMNQLGLKRRAKPMLSLSEYLNGAGRTVSPEQHNDHKESDEPVAATHDR